MKLNEQNLIIPPWVSPYRAVCLLPFTVRLSKTYEDLAKVVQIRSSSYGRHVPEIGHLLASPESDDFRDDVLHLIVESKLDGSVLGSIRLQPNITRPLRIEGECEMPEKYQVPRKIELMRLGVKNGADGLSVNFAIYKACCEICYRCGFEYIFVAGRNPLNRLYKALQYEDVLDGETVPLSYAAGIQHNIFALPVDKIHELCDKTYPTFRRFLCEEDHPDIDIDYDTIFECFGQRKEATVGADRSLV